MYPFIYYFNIFTVPLFCLFAVGEGWIMVPLAFALSHLLHPLLDALLQGRAKKWAFGVPKKTGSSFFYELPLFLALPLQALLLIKSFKFGLVDIGSALQAGVLCGISGGILGIAVSHELIHRTKKWQRLMATFMLNLINYPHFEIEHLWHHRSVGTPKDPDTAKLNEGLYRFWLRSIPKGWVDCWSWRPMKTKMLALTGIQVAINALIYSIFGIKGLLFFLTQGLVTILLLKWINYVEHYGVKRKIVHGRLEPVRHEHSWDCTSPLTNFSLFNLGFHSQHHMKASIPYHELPDSKDHWNELPYGYSAMMVIALVPPLWRKLMNPRVEKAFSYES